MKESKENPDYLEGLPTIAIEDLTEAVIQDTLSCIRKTISDCESLCLDNKADRNLFLEVAEKYIREVFDV